MLHFKSPRTKLFRKRRRLRLRHAVLTVVIIGTASAGLSFLMSAPQPQIASFTDAAAVAAIVPAPAYYAQRPEETAALPAPAAVENVSPQQVLATFKNNADTTEPAVTTLARIQTGLDTIVKASTDFISQKKLSVGKGDTLMTLLVRNNVPRGEAYDAIQALSKFYDPRDLNPGHAVTVFFHQDPDVVDPKFSGLEIRKDTVSTVYVNRDEDGSYKADEQEKEVRRTLKGFKGTIDGSLYASAKAQGVPDSVILDMIKMYSMNVDFQRDLQSGNGFEVMYEEYLTDTGEIAPQKGNIVYSKLSLDGRTLPFYRYTDKSGSTDYYDADGKSAKKSLMKTPIDGARISSGFGMRRHPVLGYSKMHKGIDFAAPRGTPIYAAGDGLIEKMGPFSSYGNYVKIKHSSGIETAYAHMQGFKAGLHSGNRVKQGQVIGYVGTTGRSTGAHLHYEIMMAGVQVNPNSVKLPTGNALAGRDLASFKAFVGQTDRKLQQMGAGTPVAANAAAPATHN